MTLEEAIAHLDESLNDNGRDWGCEACKHEHAQLRGWLAELRRRRAGEIKPVVRCGECDKYYYADNRVPEQRRWVCSEHGDVEPDWYCGDGIKREEGL